MRWIAAAVLCVVLALRAAVSFAAEALAEAEALVRAGRAEEAWQLLAPLEARHAGEPDFDYLLGLAALESGRPNRATFVLERVIAVNPGHLAARLEMARAYFALNDHERAEREFDFILRSAAPEDIRKLSAAYLDRIRDATRRGAADVSGYAEAAFGRDTNVSAAAAQGSFFVPGLGIELIADPAFQRRPDDFVSLGAGIEYARALGLDSGLVLGADARQRWHSDAERFDFRALDLQAIFEQRLGARNSLRYSVRHGEYELDAQRYRTTQSIGAEWGRRLEPRTRVGLSAEAHRIRYRTQDAAAASSDLAAVSASAAHFLDASMNTTLYTALYAGSDNAVAGRVDGDRRLFGASVGLQRPLLPGLEAYLRLSMLRSDYRTENPDFGLKRRDDQIDGAIGLAWAFARGWVLRPQVLHTYNESNIPLNEYRRTETSIALQRVWD
jgi:thioredoxin-like negative regulator of GroEL